jgi:hypothetical protein
MLPHSLIRCSLITALQIGVSESIVAFESAVKSITQFFASDRDAGEGIQRRDMLVVHEKCLRTNS